MKPKFDSAAKGDPSALITVSNVEKRYGKQRVLNIKEFCLNDKDFTMLKGPNGAGKSTFLKVLAGISLPSSGRLQHSPRFLKLRTAFVPQAGGLISHLSVLENLEVLRRMYGRSRDMSFMDQWYIHGLDLIGHLHKPVKALSGGFQRIAAMACTLAMAPDGLFIDEPFNGLDYKKSALVAKNLAAFAEANAFVVISNHQDVDFLKVTQTVSLYNGWPQ